MELISVSVALSQAAAHGAGHRYGASALLMCPFAPQLSLVLNVPTHERWLD